MIFLETAKILIVDDEPFNINYLEQELEDLGYETFNAFNGADALEKVGNTSPDLVLLDIMMPVMDGFTVLEKMKEEKSTREIPVIIISALNDMPNIIKGIELGAEDYLPKPYDPILLRARLHSALRKRAWDIQEKRYLRQIEVEKQRADSLLRVILPEEIVGELKATNQVEPRSHPDVAVLFADVVGFTPYSERRSPQEVLNNFQLLVEAYELLAQEYELQKIKTIGDAFMAAGGLLKPLGNPVLNCVRCGIKMISEARQLPDPWQVRVGINFGPVMAGVVGKQQYLYDIWGDVVNTAQRAESHGQPGMVNLTLQAYETVKDHFPALTREIKEVKGKGLMELITVGDGALKKPEEQFRAESLFYEEKNNDG
jgi:adenylate cyclase